jgi:hypothetical protein
VNAKNKDGYTPLHRTAINSYADAARLLISSGADVNAKDKESRTPLDIALEEEDPEVTNVLALAMLSFAKLDDAMPLSVIRGLWLAGFPASEGYLSVGSAFGKHFSDGTWKITDKQHETMTVLFSGVFDNSGKKEPFSLELEVKDVQNPTIRPVKATINKMTLSEDALNDLLSAIFLDAKK